MKSVKGLVVFASVVALAGIIFAPMASAGAEYDRATGGGQIFLSTQGAGDTLAFTAQNTGGNNDAAKGQLQYVSRSSPAAPSHGVVDCLVVTSGNYADIAGHWTSGANVENDGWELKVTDRGQGQDPDDLICFEPNADNNECDNESGAGTSLGRGNAQIYQA